MSRQPRQTRFHRSVATVHVMISATLAAQVATASCSPNEEEQGDLIETPTFVLDGAERVGEDVEWGDLEEFDVRASDGAVVALDRYASRIHVLGIPGGTSFGRAGEGPGEIPGAGPIVATQETIVQISRGRISAWDYQGSFINGAVSRSALGAFEWDSGWVAARSRDFGERSRQYDNRFDVWPADLSSGPKPLFRYADLEDFPTDSITGDISGTRELGLFGMLRAGASAPIRIDPDDDSVTRFPPIQREQAKWTPEEWTRYVRSGYTSVMYESPMPRLRAMFQNALSRPVKFTPNFDKRLIPYESSIGIHEDDQIWVMIGVPLEERTVFDVFDPTGTKLGTVRIPGLVVERIRLKGDWLVVLSFDDLDRPELRRFGIGAVVDSLTAAASGRP